MEDSGRGSGGATELPRRAAEAAAWALVAVAAAVRLPGLGEWWPNPDEGMHLLVATAPTWRDFLAELAPRAHPPLFFVLLRGVASLTDDPGLLRLPFALLGALAAHGVYRMGREWFGPVAGLVGAFAVALSPAAQIQSEVLRPYSLQLVLLAYALSFLPAAAERGSRRALAGYAVAMGLALLTHYGSLLLLPWTAAALLLAARRGPLPLRAAVGAHLLLGVLVAAALGPHLLHLAGSEVQARAQTTWLEPFLAESALEGARAALRFHQYVFSEPLGVAAALAFAAGAVGLALRRRGAALALSLGPFVLVLGASFAQLYPFGATRHVLFLLPSALLALGFAASFVAARPRALALAAAALALAVAARGPIAGLVGAGSRPGLFQEHVLRARSLRALEPFLRTVHSGQVPVLMDRQTYLLLFPLLPGHREGGSGREGPAFARFRWDEAEVLVSGTLVMSPLPPRLAPTDSLAAFLRELDEGLPELALAERSELWLLFGGWSVERYLWIRAFDRRTPRHRILRSRPVVREALGGLRFDPRAYLRALDAVEARLGRAGTRSGLRAPGRAARAGRAGGRGPSP